MIKSIRTIWYVNTGRKSSAGADKAVADFKANIEKQLKETVQLTINDQIFYVANGDNPTYCVVHHLD